MKPGVFRLALLFIAGTTRAWYLYLVSALLGCVFLLTFNKGQAEGDLTAALAMSALFGGVIWFSGTAGMLATLRGLRELRAPHVYRKAGVVVGLVALLTLIMPTTLLSLAGDATAGSGTIRHTFMTLALGSTIGMLAATLPLPLVSAGLLLGPLMIVVFPTLGTQLTHTALWQSGWLKEAIMLPALPIVAWRCRAVIRAETTGGLAWSSAAQMRVTMSNLFVATGQDPNAAYRMFPAWMVPSWRTRAGASLWTRISTLMGPPFAPGNLRQLLPTLVIIGGIGALFLWFLLERVLSERVPVHVHRTILDTLVPQIPTFLILVLLPTTRTFAGRLRMIHRPQSADLAELALLPGLGGATTALANYSLVLFGRPLRMLAAIAALLGGIAAVLAPSILWSLLLLVLMIAGLAVKEIARYLALGRPYIQNIFFEALASMVVVLPLGTLVFLSARTPFVEARTSNAFTYLVIPGMVGIVLLAAIHGARRAYARAAQLPHPFLDADERRVMSRGSTDS